MLIFAGLGVCLVCIKLKQLERRKALNGRSVKICNSCRKREAEGRRKGPGD